MVGHEVFEIASLRMRMTSHDHCGRGRPGLPGLVAAGALPHGHCSKQVVGGSAKHPLHKIYRSELKTSDDPVNCP